MLNLYEMDYSAGMWRKYVKKEKEIGLFKHSFSYLKLTGANRTARRPPYRERIELLARLCYTKTEKPV